MVAVTDGVTSYAVFTYLCGEMEWGTSSGDIGIATGQFGYYRKHRLSGSSDNNRITCLNTNAGYTVIVYKLTNIGMTSLHFGMQ